MSLRRSRTIAAICALGALIALSCACSPATRYSVLSFFFDGVPLPPGSEVEEDAAGDERRLSEFRLALAKLNRPPVVDNSIVIVSTHQPVRENRCRLCHDPRTGMEEPPSDATLCDRCHGDQRHEEKWDHGPLNLGTCIPCHNAHESQYEHLLTQPVPDLCLHCHTGLDAEQPAYHQVANLDQCSECHDPHKMY